MIRSSCELGRLKLHHIQSKFEVEAVRELRASAQ